MNRSITRALTPGLLLVALLLSGCETAPQVSDRNISTINYEELVRLIEKSKKPGELMLIDVRSVEDYRKGHIPGAINISLPLIRANDPRLAKAREIVVYAKDWRRPISAAAAKRMLALGYQNVHDFRAGLEAWREAGRKVEMIPADRDD
ncbi:MAG: rhodanese-like domain-containing protein [Phycisphaeraceae bacterium]|nr:rhodanese-like domain-containing protein [Phycisphaeraceae bacterium]